jgi:hypothetical protein
VVRAYGFLLRLYPNRYRAQFREEMIQVFAQVEAEERDRGLWHCLSFLAAEMWGVLCGSGFEWAASVRRVGQPVVSAANSHDHLPAAASEMYLRIEANLRRMEYAIAHHQFPQARRYSEIDQQQRAQLARLCEEHEKSS